MPAPPGSHATEDQREVLAFLSAPGTHGAGAVERIDTHGSIVFLAGERAIKVKRAVRYPYMDYGTLACRRAACEREVSLNRRTAPELYLGAEPIVRRADGSLALGGAGEPIEWAVIMRRVPADDLLDRRAAAGRLDDTLLLEAADAIATQHAGADVVASNGLHGGGRAGVLWVIGDNAGGLGEHPAMFPLAEVTALGLRSLTALDGLAGLLDDRLTGGKVRRCHGDLHIGNLCVWHGRATLFDAIEFNDRLANIDVLYDVAFVLMELDQRVGRRAANLVLNRYLRRMDDLEGLAALPLFLSLRAAVKAKVSAAAAMAQGDEAKRSRQTRAAQAYFRAASGYLEPVAPRLVAIGGRSGSGKSTVARALAPRLGVAPGALHLRSDVIRKSLFGVEDETRLPNDAYAPEVSERVYRLMAEHAARALKSGHAVVADAVHDRPEGRQTLAALAATAGVRFDGIWLQASPATMRARLEARRHDASDATPAVLDLQLAHDPGPMDWIGVAADGTVDEVVARVAGALGLPLTERGPDPDLRL